MFCSKCNKTISNSAKFCNYCGEIQHGDDENKVDEKNKNPLLIKAAGLLGHFVTIGGAIIGYSVAKLFGIYTLIFVVPIVIGFRFPNWYMKRNNPNKNILDIIIWSNLVTWFIPVVGLGTSIMSINLAKFIDSPLKDKAIRLGWISLGLSVANGILGIYLKLPKT